MNLWQRRKIGYGCLIVFYLLIGSYILTIAYPPQRRGSLGILLAYPDTVAIVKGQTGLFVGYLLEANSTFAEGVNVSITIPQAVIVSPNYHDVLYVASGFEETLPNAKCNYAGGVEFVGGGFAGVIFGHFDQQSDSLATMCNTTFRWLTAGDYSPVMIIEFNNGSTIEHRYDEIKVHVASTIELQAAAIGNIELAVTVALLLFAFIEGIAIVHDLTGNEGSTKIVKISTPSPRNRNRKSTDLPSKRKTAEKKNRDRD